MRLLRVLRLLSAAVALAAVLALLLVPLPRDDARPAGKERREEVVFWHFWGGTDRRVVQQVVARFNASQRDYWVRAVAMPGNNLDLKLFLAITGGDPPDLINQDDPIVADWARRAALTPLDELATPAEMRELREFLVPAARQLTEYRGRMYGLCNGLDVRALYYNKTVLDDYGLSPPETLAELDALAVQTTRRDAEGRYQRIGYLPDSRRLWAWGVVFGGRFYDPDTGRATAHEEAIVRALKWMTSYRQRYGVEQMAAFRQGDQSLPGKTFPLLAGRYTLVMDGQWRLRDIAAAQQAQREAGRPVTEFGVCPLPCPPGGRRHAGWVNGNFFVVPRGARQPQGAWAFMKYWTGLDGHQAEAAQTCMDGGWIPVSRAVADQPAYRDYLQQQPLMATFVQLAASENQLPTPVIPGAPLFVREINEAAGQAMLVKSAPPPAVLLRSATRRVQAHLDRLQETAP